MRDGEQWINKGDKNGMNRENDEQMRWDTTKYKFIDAYYKFKCARDTMITTTNHFCLQHCSVYAVDYPCLWH